MSQISHYPAAPFGDWDGSPAAARAMQLTLAAQVRLQDDFPALRLRWTVLPRRKPGRVCAAFADAAC